MPHLFDPQSPLGAIALALIFLLAAYLLTTLVRQATARVEAHLSDVTGLAFTSSLAKVAIYVMAFVLYAHLVPALRALGTALLAGVSVVSVVIGMAAQNTLGNLIAGFSLVLYRSVRVGDRLQITTPSGVTTAKVELLSLGYTVLRDVQGSQVLVPNSVMISNVVVRLPPESPEPAPPAKA